MPTSLSPPPGAGIKKVDRGRRFQTLDTPYLTHYNEIIGLKTTGAQTMVKLYEYYGEKLRWVQPRAM